MSEHRSTSRVLNILQAVASSLDGHTLSGLAELLDAPRSSVFPILHTMADRGFLILDPKTMKYSTGIQSHVVGSSYIGKNDTYKTVYNEMETIGAHCAETCQLGVLDRGEVLYIGKVDSTEAIRLASHVGERLPPHCTALGKALMSHLSFSDVATLCREPLKQLTPHTITSLDALYEQIQRVRDTGIAEDDQETQENVNCRATPIRHQGAVVCSISVSTPSFRFTGEKESLIRASLLETKQRLEGALAAMEVALPFRRVSVN